MKYKSISQVEIKKYVDIWGAERLSQQSLIQLADMSSLI